jgi:ubiquinone biosynthesis protein
MIWGTLGAARDLSRLREISSVLIRHGLGDLVRRTGLASALERAGQILHWGDAGKSAEIEPQERFRRSLEELGPTFVKLGQVLSTRPDLLSPSWIAELERLHSDVAPISFDELLPQVEKALGRSPFDVFADVVREPHAAASIAQVHRAKLPSGAPVVLKIRRPGISAKIAADLRLLDHLANLIEHEMPEARRYAPVQVVAQFRRSLERELDLAVEARHVDRFARNFADDPHILIPKVYWDFISSLMNVQEYVAGIRGTDLSAITAADLDRKVLAARGSDAVLKMILVDDFFHADPHPGKFVSRMGSRSLFRRPHSWTPANPEHVALSPAM